MHTLRGSVPEPRSAGAASRPWPPAAGPSRHTSFLDPDHPGAGSTTCSCSPAPWSTGFMQGIHRSPYLGVSMDFAEHRQYMPGDDIRRIDWRLFGAHRPLLHQAVRGRDERGRGVPARHFRVDGVRLGRNHQAGLRALPDREPGLVLGRTRRTGWGCTPSTATWSSTCGHRRAHLEKVLHAVARVKAERAGAWDRLLARVANTFRAARHHGRSCRISTHDAGRHYLVGEARLFPRAGA